MPQGSWLGTLIFIVLIDDLRLLWLTHTYLDDTTISETIVKDTVSEMQLAVNALIEWSELNRRNINCKKGNVFGSISKESPTPLLIAAKPVQQVSEYKFLGVTVNSRIEVGDDHIAAITSKADKRLWFVAGVARVDLVYFNPVFENTYFKFFFFKIKKTRF